MSEQFTKGPWEHDWSSSDVSAGGFIICDTCSDGSQESEANAALIACAPEMYEMLKWLSVAVLKDGSIAHKNAVELLAKARGEA